jgi:hypothetical protein
MHCLIMVADQGIGRGRIRIHYGKSPSFWLGGQSCFFACRTYCFTVCNLLFHSCTTVSILPDTYPYQDLDLSQTLCRICKDLRVCGVIAAGYNIISFPPMSTSLNLRLRVIGNISFLLLALLVQLCSEKFFHLFTSTLLEINKSSDNCSCFCVLLCETCLTFLTCFSHNDLGPEGSTVLARAIQPLTRLTHLDLGYVC